MAVRTAVAIWRLYVTSLTRQSFTDTLGHSDCSFIVEVNQLRSVS